MISLEEAIETVLSVAKWLPPVTLPIHESFGKILAQDVGARDPLPPYRASIMDGYALVTSDGPGEYPVILSEELEMMGMVSQFHPERLHMLRLEDQYLMVPMLLCKLRTL